MIPAPDRNAQIAATIRAGSLRELTQNLWPHHAGVARNYGLDLLLYEAGSHVVLDHESDDSALVAALNAFSYSPEMAGLYADAITAWRQIGHGPYMAFVEVAQDNRWGAWGALRHLSDMNPRAATLMAWNSLPAATLPDRGHAFSHGVIRRAELDAASDLHGTTKSDILIGGAGDDIFTPHGGHDLINGGAGRDRVILPGALADWQAATDGTALWLMRVQDAVRLVGVEEITFEAAPDDVLYPPVPN